VKLVKVSYPANELNAIAVIKLFSYFHRVPITIHYRYWLIIAGH